jgi:hypothetical protein
MNLLFICRSKIKIVFTTKSLICSLSSTFLFMVFVFHILHHPPLCYNFPVELHLHSITNILAFVVFFYLQIPCIYKV